MDNSWDNICYERKIYNKDTILAELKEKGCRITKKRKILINIILKNECASCKEIHWEAVQTDPTIGIATVYRMLRCLEEIGVINRKNLFKISDDYIDCLRSECTILLKNKNLFKIPGELWEKTIKNALIELCIEPGDVESVLLKKTY